jgi:hypothetical protein
LAPETCHNRALAPERQLAHAAATAPGGPGRGQPADPKNYNLVVRQADTPVTEEKIVKTVPNVT